MNLVEHPTTLPRLEPGSIERTRLLARLAEARHKTCVMILGPAIITVQDTLAKQ